MKTLDLNEAAAFLRLHPLVNDADSLEGILSAAISTVAFPGIYFLMQEGEIVYIGQSRNVQNRIAQHGDKRFDSYAVLPCPDATLEKNERRLILKFKPKYNTLGKNN
ncbi:MAG: GIY-YIG nuclease family protein [Betaproteobacteria bacterium]|nr:GIY-YIG nuclease family protein [Betaproteobacteria bacterium]